MALEDPTAFQALLRAAVAMRQAGMQGLQQQGIQQELQDAVVRDIPVGTLPEQQAAWQMLYSNPPVLMYHMYNRAKEIRPCCRLGFPKVMVGSEMCYRFGLDATNYKVHEFLDMYGYKEAARTGVIDRATYAGPPPLI